MGAISLSEVTKRFGSSETCAVDSCTLDIADGEFLVLVGPSGCGKSTLLRMIAGIESVSSGQISIDSADVTGLPPKARDIAMVFQSYALYPHMTVFQNLEFGLKLRKVGKAERREQIADVMNTLRLDALDGRKPGQLSGGQRQRVAMGRAMVREPTAFLMDEPLSNLDAKLRVTMRAELARLHERLGVTTIYVTHDQTEAMTLGDRVAVLRDGELQQVDTPQALYNAPRNLFVASFIGSPAINLVEAEVTGTTLNFAGHSFPLPFGVALGGRKKVVVGIRPSDLELGAAADHSMARVHGRVEVIEDLGAQMHVVFPVEAPRVQIEESSAEANSGGADDRLFADERTMFTAVVPAHGQIAVGEEIELAVDPKRFQLFDASSGASLGAGSEQPPARPPKLSTAAR